MVTKEWRKEYQRKWRRAHPNYGKEWRKKHPNYLKEWGRSHPSYWQRYKEKKDAYMREYTQRPEVKLRQREYQLGYKRLHYLSTKTGRIRVNKRLYPSDQCCEVCGVEHQRLVYHHWDNTDLGKGVWVCYLCHQLAEGVDRGLVPKYLKLKQLVNKYKGGQL